MLHPPSVPEQPWVRQRIRAPRGDRTLCTVPPLAGVSQIARENQELLLAADVRVQGRSLQQLREWTRGEVFRAAQSYTSLWAGDAAIPATAEPPRWYFVSGHQPTLSHPGVWVKNFVVSELARREGASGEVPAASQHDHAPAASGSAGRSVPQAIGLNLVVDNDLFAMAAIRAPAGNRDNPAFTTIAFDDPQPPQPFAGVEVRNADLFRSFGDRVAEAMAPWGITPLAREFWPAAVAQLERSSLLVDCLTAARNQWERRWGADNLELPLSRLCRLDPFLWFASHLLAQLPRLHRIYNEVLGEFRAVNKIRSRTHPVPDLREQDGWLEAPFWMWRTGDRVRKRVFARSAGKEILLSDGTDVFARLPLSEKGDACCAVEVLRGLPSQNIHFRTRALTTTLFTRLFLADLFVHGIGGAKYDEMTDRICTRFFGVAPPGFLTLSATLELPLQPHDTQPADAARLRTLLRELDYNSDRHLQQTQDPSVAALVGEKQRLIDQQPTRSAVAAQGSHRGRGAGYARLRRLHEIAVRLSEFTRDQRRQIEDELARTLTELSANQVLQSREFAACLYPATKLHDFLQHVRAF